MWHTLRTATRALRARPIASGAIVGILAGGIGANTAMFLLVDATLFRPLPFPSAERIVRVIGKSPQALVRFDVTGVSVWPETADPRVFGAIGVYSTGGLNLGGSDSGHG